MERIARLRAESLGNLICYDEFFLRFYTHYFENTEEVFEKRYADAYFHALSTLTPSITEGELIVGKPRPTLSSEEDILWRTKYLEMAKEELKKTGGGQDSHMAIDYEFLLSSGISGIIKKIDSYLTYSDKGKKLFYETAKKCLLAVLNLSENYADALFVMAQNSRDEKTKEELLKVSGICRKVPKYPAETFHEALQSVHFITYCLSMNPLRLNRQQFQLGHPDRYLLPYYLKDIENSILTKKDARILLDCLGIQINNRVPSGLSSGYMVGGRYKNGDLSENELTLLLMQVIEDIKLVYPSVGLCYTGDSDEKYLEKACDIILKGHSHPAIFNDDIITEGLRSYGVPEREAHNYIHSTCVEITPVSSSNVWVASPYTNMTQLFLDLLDREYKSFDQLLERLFASLDEKIGENFKNENEIRKKRSKNSINPLLSCFVNDCLERGCDIEKGGARYNWIMPSFVGMANLVDSLYALKTMVFDKKEISISELKAILEKDFDGYEALRLRLLNTIPKYGNDKDEVDSYFSLISKHISKECEKYNGDFNNSRLIPSVFCWIMHDLFGRETGATPDGRKKGFPLGDRSGPCQGREINGPTASIISSTKWEHKKFIGGVAVNMKFSKKSLGSASPTILKTLILTYLKRGGFEMQINVIDRETLEKAVLSPENYKDLVVRIGGYSDYFVRLSPHMQKEVILRTEHKI